MVTPIDVQVYQQLLVSCGYDSKETEFLVKGFTDGFSLGYEGPRNIRRLSPNLKLECGTEEDLWDKVMKEVNLNGFAGPFAQPPFPNFIQSPIGLVPKGNGGVRLIFHLSYPRGGSSVNSETPKSICTVNYNDLDKAIGMCIQEGPGCYVAKFDMHLPIRPEDWGLLVMKARDPLTKEFFYFVDKCLLFGSSISCALFQRFSNSVAYIFKVKTNKDTNNYLDDFFFAALLQTLCDVHVQVFLDLCKTINFPAALNKTVWATQLIVLLGILIDTIKQTVSIQSKREIKQEQCWWTSFLEGKQLP